MQLNQVQRNNPNRRKRARVGRGGKRGTTSGKGTKGQKSRSGRRIRPAVRDLIQRLPKLRGHANKPKQVKTVVLNVGDIDGLGISVLNLVALRKLKAIGNRDVRVKILGNGELKTAVTVEKIPVSKEARKKIEAAGGKVS